MAAHCSVPVGRVPWAEEPGRLQSMGSQSRTRLGAHVSVSAYVSTAEHVRLCVRVKEPGGRMGRMKHFCYRR